jgi:hypothetical protein
MELLSEFVTHVKNECVMDQHYFSFFEIPELIVKKGYSRKEYEDFLLKLLNKVKTRYLAQKKLDNPDTPLEQMQVTDDDLVRLELFDEVMSSIQNKISESRSYHMAFIKECHAAINAVQLKLALDSQKTKMMVE